MPPEPAGSGVKERFRGECQLLSRHRLENRFKGRWIRAGPSFSGYLSPTRDAYPHSG